MKRLRKNTIYNIFPTEKRNKNGGFSMVSKVFMPENFSVYNKTWENVNKYHYVLSDKCKEFMFKIDIDRKFKILHKIFLKREISYMMRKLD
ncbi:hypothetical protein NEPTK9_001493 [Candidatus Neptunochlamydia vexilliferae]|uniref:Uncharacterized protein n=1 Tax=Candidatus Neptunichlamydia vexilliferae TaxID=1651774 RepID=A0ABS0B0Q5_9BACT|nr:hypothetical protein [Candidatus Neptunochlamydia vexilliferae]